MARWLAAGPAPAAQAHRLDVQFTRTDAPWAGVYRSPQFTNDATARTIRRKQKPQHWQRLGPGTYQAEDGGPRLVRSVIYARSEHGRAPGGMILDPMAGSGTAGVVAREHGMNAVLIEARGDYVDLIRDRLRDDTPLLRIEA